tara:strand:- start:63 stop:395 length:333 start_codon:yes stop_codon:yes gene_type:complete
MSLTIEKLLSTWNNALTSGDVSEISRLLDDNFKFINLHQGTGGENKVEHLDWVKTKPCEIYDFNSLHEDANKIVGTHKVKDEKGISTVMFYGTLKDDKLIKYEIIRGFDY